MTIKLLTIKSPTVTDLIQQSWI